MQKKKSDAEIDAKIIADRKVAVTSGDNNKLLESGSDQDGVKDNTNSEKHHVKQTESKQDNEDGQDTEDEKDTEDEQKDEFACDDCLGVFDTREQYEEHECDITQCLE